jgi:hypothetical protein
VNGVDATRIRTRGIEESSGDDSNRASWVPGKVAEADVILNDDLRDVHVDYPALQALGFSFVRVRCDEPVRLRRLAGRSDLSSRPAIGHDVADLSGRGPPKPHQRDGFRAWRF